MSSSKRSLSLPAAARRASKKATKQVPTTAAHSLLVMGCTESQSKLGDCNALQAVPHYSQPQAGEDDRRLLAQLMAADPGAEVGVDADADADELLPAELHQPVAVAADAPDVEAAANARAEADEITEQQSHDSAHQAEELMPHGAGVQGQQVDQQQQSLQPAPSILTVSDQTLVHQAAPTVTSPTVATGMALSAEDLQHISCKHTAWGSMIDTGHRHRACWQYSTPASFRLQMIQIFLLPYSLQASRGVPAVRHVFARLLTCTLHQLVYFCFAGQRSKRACSNRAKQVRKNAGPAMLASATASIAGPALFVLQESLYMLAHPSGQQGGLCTRHMSLVTLR